MSIEVVAWAVVQQVLVASGEFTDAELVAIRRLNDPGA